MSPAFPAAVFTTGASSCPTPRHRLLPPHPSINTPPQPSHTRLPPILRPPHTTPPPLFHTSTLPCPLANIPLRPSLAPPDLGLPASLSPPHPLPHSPSAHQHRQASDTCTPPARSPMHIYRASQSGMDSIVAWQDMQVHTLRILIYFRIQKTSLANQTKTKSLPLLQN